MNLVAIHGLKPGKESLANALASVLKVTIYEALSRLRSPGNGPVTVAVFAEEEAAIQLAERLRAAGFDASVLMARESEAEANAIVAKRFALGPRELSVEAGKDNSLSIFFQDIGLILRGTGIFLGTATETEKTRSIAMGRAVLSGGLMITKTTKSVREVSTEEREGFVNIYAGDQPTLVLRENTLIYDSLGPALKLSRAANFNYLIAELRRRCPNAQYDERLLTRAAQAALLGPSLIPEKHLAVATALLAKALRGGT